MPSNKPRTAFVIEQEILDRVKDFQEKRGCKSQSQAMIALIEIGLNDFLRENTQFTTEEFDLLEQYRTLDGHGKEVVRSVLDIEYKRVAEKAKRFVVKKSDIDYLQVPFAARGGGLQKSNEKRAKHLKKLEEYFKKEGDGES